MTKISRNDPCPCGSGKKYKKCCQAADAARVVALDTATVDVFRPAAMPVGDDLYAPAIACLKEEEEGRKKTCLFVLVRPSRGIEEEFAMDEAADDLDSQPDATDGTVGPGCLRYLDKIGYRSMPAGEFDRLKFAPPASGAKVCAVCGEVHGRSVDDDAALSHEEDLGEPNGEYEKPDFEDDEEDLPADTLVFTELVKNLLSLGPDEIQIPRLVEEYRILRAHDLTHEEAVVLVLERAVARSGADPKLAESPAENQSPDSAETTG